MQNCQFQLNHIHKHKLVFTCLLLLFSSLKSFSWGGRGHDSICEAAVHLVKNSELKEFLKTRPHTMGHLCNVPDIYWKSLSSKQKKYGDPSHFIDPEIIGLKIKDVPIDYTEIITKYTGTTYADNTSKKINFIPIEFGSSWWRAQQIYQLSVSAALVATEQSKSNPTMTKKNEQDEEFGYNKAVYEMMVTMGLLGHFVGDNSQPFHATADYDGYNAHHGGIHSYYEEACVVHFGPDLHSRIVKQAEKYKTATFLKPTSAVEKMKLLALSSEPDLQKIYKLDPIIKPSSLKVEKGMSLRTPAERHPPSVGFKKFEKIIVDEMARSAVLLAHLWDQIYENGQKPNLKLYKSYKYPFTPEFIMPDYFKVPAEETDKK